MKRKYNGKTDIAKFISFRFKCFRFISVFRNIFVSVFVSVNRIKIFPLTDISVSVNVNHTGHSHNNFAPVFCLVMAVKVRGWA